MLIATKFKETTLSVAPIVAIALALGAFVTPLGASLLIRFALGGVAVIVGLSLFLLGVDTGVCVMGRYIGSALVSRRSLLLLLTASLLTGFMVTISEPDIQVFAGVVASAFSGIDKTTLVLAISAGVGVFITVGLLRSVFALPLKVTMAVLYAIVFFLVAVVDKTFVGVAFDSGGATTGPLTVPFILALGLGVTSVSKNTSSSGADSFGLTGVASVGPVLAVLICALVLGVSSGGEVAQTASQSFGALCAHLAKDALVSIAPLVLILVASQFLLLHLEKVTFIKIAVGLVWSYIGLLIFLIGVNSGFMTVGQQIGKAFAQKCTEESFWKALFVATGFVLGAAVVLSEPAVQVLSGQIEEVTGGAIKKRLILIFLCLAGSAAVGVYLLSVMLSWPLWKVLLAGYTLSLLLMTVSPPLFTAIAFDSGGVASGPITSTFVLSFTLGGSGGSNGGFGVIALVALSPLIALQVLGVLWRIKTSKLQSGENG